MSAVNLAADAIGDALDNGYLRLYAGTPERGRMLAELRLRGFAAAEKGRILANPIGDSFAVANGDATWGRILDASQTPFFDGRIGEEIGLRDTALQDGALVRCKSLSVTVK